MAHCYNTEPGEAPSGTLWLLQSLPGASRLHRLDISGTGPTASSDGWPPVIPSLAGLGMTQLTQLVMRGGPVAGDALQCLLQGLTSLRRLVVGGGGTVSGAAGSGGVLGSDVGGLGGGEVSRFDDGSLEALARCGLTRLEELDASFSGLEGRFGSAAAAPGAAAGAAVRGAGVPTGAGSSSVGSGDAELGNPWAGVSCLKVLRLHGSKVVSWAAVALLASALGATLEKLSIGRVWGSSLEAAALAVLSQRMGALRELQLHGGELTVTALEASLPRLVRLERLGLWRQDPLLCDAERLAPLAQRLQHVVLLLDDADVSAAAHAEGCERGGRRQGRRSSAGGDGGRAGGSGGGQVRKCRLALYDERVRYSTAELERLRGSRLVDAATQGVRRSLLDSADAGDGGDVRFCGINFMQSDW